MNKKVTLSMILKNFERLTDESARLLAGKLLDYAESCVDSWDYKQAAKVLKPLRARLKNNPRWLDIDNVVSWEFCTRLLVLEEQVRLSKEG